MTSSTQNNKHNFVNVLINCYNGEKYLKETLDSVFAQSYENWNIIFWDNNSQDKTGEIAKSYGPKLKYFKADKTVPLYEARSLAIKECTGDFVAILDSDDLWTKDKLEKQIPLFEKNKNVGLVYSDCTFFKDNKTVARVFSSHIPHRGNCQETIFQNNFIPLQSVVFRKSFLEKLDYIFDKDLMMNGDIDLYRRLSLICEFDFVPEVLAKWRIHDENLSVTNSDLFVSEAKKLIEKYQNLLPRLTDNHQKLLALAKDEYLYSHSRELWKQGKKTQSLKELLKISQKNLKHLRFFLLSRFSYTFINNMKYKLTSLKHKLLRR